MFKDKHWIVPPRCQGQIVEIAYLAHDCRLYRRSIDASDGEVCYWEADLPEAPEGEGWEFDPVNAEPYGIDWEEI